MPCASWSSFQAPGIDYFKTIWARSITDGQAASDKALAPAVEDQLLLCAFAYFDLISTGTPVVHSYGFDVLAPDGPCTQVLPKLQALGDNSTGQCNPGLLQRIRRIEQ
jgi:hypothetical protein